MRLLSRTPFVLAVLFAGAVHAQNGEIVATVSDAQGRPLADAVIVAFPADGNVRLTTKARDDAIFQVDKEFVPKVTPVLVGTAVAFPNNDTVRHHVYSFSPAKKFELPLYQGVPANPVVFDTPGVVVLGCNIHDWMVAYIYVSESPHFAKSGADGKATISDLVPRAYVVRAWHPQLEGEEEQTRKSVDLSKTRRSEVSWSLRLKPEVRVRRAPATKQSGSY
jgi:plastocyanin